MQSLSNDPNALIGLTNEIGASGKFLRMARSGQVVSVSGLILGRDAIVRDLSQIEEKLCACNNPVALAEFVMWCTKRRKRSDSELLKKVHALETKKLQLQTELHQIDSQLAQAKLEFEWTTTSSSNSLVPRVVRTSDLSVADRNEMIDQHLNRSHAEICRILDMNFSRDEATPAEGFPATWTRKYAVHTYVQAYRHPKCRGLVHKMMSVRRARQRLP